MVAVRTGKLTQQKLNWIRGVGQYDIDPDERYLLKLLVSPAESDLDVGAIVRADTEARGAERLLARLSS